MRIIITITCCLLCLGGKTQFNPYQVRAAIAESVNKLAVPIAPVHHILNKELSGGDFTVPVRVYYPSDQSNLPILYHIHGGAWVAGNLDTHDNICRNLSIELGVIVVAVDYRRPPEYRYPVANEDNYFVLQWIANNQEELGGDGRLFLIGDSAGGNFVPSTILKNAQATNPISIDGQILINPSMDMRSASASINTYKAFIDEYLPEGVDRNKPIVSPLATTDFSVFPPSIIVVSEKDALRPEGLQFHEKLTAAGVESHLYELKSTGHLAAQWATKSEIALPAFQYVCQQFKQWLQ